MRLPWKPPSPSPAAGLAGERGKSSRLAAHTGMRAAEQALEAALPQDRPGTRSARLRGASLGRTGADRPQEGLGPESVPAGAAVWAPAAAGGRGHMATRVSRRPAVSRCCRELGRPGRGTAGTPWAAAQPGPPLTSSRGLGDGGSLAGGHRLPQNLRARPSPAATWSRWALRPASPRARPGSSSGPGREATPH